MQLRMMQYAEENGFTGGSVYKYVNGLGTVHTDVGQNPTNILRR